MLIFIYKLTIFTGFLGILLLTKSIQATRLVTKQCQNIPENQRFDCHPANNVNSTECQQRGCCWEAVLRSSISVPYCFYPSDYPAYKLASVKQTDRGYMGSLTLTGTRQPPYPDIKTLDFSVNFETDTRLRFKLLDPANKRWEVPLPLGKPDAQPPKSRAYDVILQDAPFGIKITRKLDNEILFDTISTLAPIRFSDQFLQISTKLNVWKGYGIGEQQTTLVHDFRQWKNIALWSRDVPPGTDINLYGVQNLFVGLTDKGMAFGIFFLNSNAQEVTIQPFPALTYRTIGGVLDFFFFTGPNPNSVIQQYMDLIGQPIFPPFWSLGFHLCRYGVKNMTHLRAINTRNRNAGIPFDVQWSDIDYMQSYLDWTYDKTNYKGLPEFVEELHSNNMHYVIIVDPGISNMYPNKYPSYDEGLKLGVFINKSDDTGPLIGKVWPGTVVYPDFSHPNADGWWSSQVNDFHKQIQFDGLWIDMNEPSNFYTGSLDGCPGNKLDHPPYTPSILDNNLMEKTVCPSAKHYSTFHYNIHSMYGYFEAKSTNYALNQLESKKRPFILSRSTFAGSGRYTFHWTGDVTSDWGSMHASIAQILNFNMFGIPMVGADICGFIGNTTEELCTRWMQLGSFYPFMRNHADLHSREQDPAIWSSDALKAMTRALNIRYSILPYLYTLLYRATVNGTTVARPLFMEFPNDVSTHEIDRQFLLGSGILVSPVLTQGAYYVDAYFPDARWYDIYNGTELAGGRRKSLVLRAPLDTIVAHIRGGSIIPSVLPGRTTVETRKLPFSLIAAADDSGRACGELFWDDGYSSTSISSSVYALVDFVLDIQNKTLQSTPAHVGYRGDVLKLDRIVILGLSKAPTKVLVNGVASQFSYLDNNKMFAVFNFNATLLEKVTVTWI